MGLGRGCAERKKGEGEERSMRVEDEEEGRGENTQNACEGNEVEEGGMIKKGSIRSIRTGRKGGGEGVCISNLEKIEYLAVVDLRIR